MKAKVLFIALALAFSAISCEKEFSDNKDITVVAENGDACPLHFEYLYKADSSQKTFRVSKGKAKGTLDVDVLTSKNFYPYTFVVDRKFESYEINNVSKVLKISVWDRDNNLLYVWESTDQ